MNNAFAGTHGRTALLTLLAMIAFAANSLLCRQALGGGLIDAASFATVRTFSGAAMLALLLALRGKAPTGRPTGWRAPLMLFTYMAFFSFAYLSLSAGTGALILFGTVQLTMFAVALKRGERFSALALAGIAIALAGLVYLVLPGVTAPDPLGAALMVIAGIGWGFYTLIGRSSTEPLATTARNFLLTLPLTILVSLLFWPDTNYQPAGLLLAVASGAIASGCGYAIWYAALAGLTATRAAIIQLSVPVIAAIGGVLFLAEPLTARIIIASVLTIGGVLIVITRRTA
ncbi:MAG: DMT family transporter [Rhodobiaceae bacterium]|nr:DMT family transporter [Rhodobiaceae bacterium]MCC0055281.1 DMT family transporter [Rhodobiaceae bacterium]